MPNVARHSVITDRLHQAARVCCLAGMLVVTAADAAAAQARLIGEQAWSAGPVFQSWRFADPLAQDAARVAGASQLAVPLAASMSLGARWTLDMAAAFATGRVELESEGTGSAAEALSLSGFTDLKLRVVGRPIGDNVIVTLGLNAPTGLTNLDNEQAAAIRVLGAPGLRFAAPALGNGFGGTAGAVFTREAGGWAWALGASYELRSSYTPLEATVAGIASPTDLDPGDAFHFSIGADRLFGQHRMSLMMNADLFGDDRITVGPGTGAAAEESYHLGPAFTATWQLEIGATRFQQLVLYVVDRYRSQFTGIDGEKVAGSSGNAIDFGVTSLLGSPGRLGYVVRLDGRYDGGLEVDNSITTAAMVAGGATFGLAIPAGRRASILPYVRAQFGQIDTGPESTSATGLSIGVTLGTR